PLRVQVNRGRLPPRPSGGPELPEAALLRHTFTLFQNPLDTETRYQRGLLLHHYCRDWKAATADFSVVLALNPQHVGAYVARGHAHNMLDQWPQAVADFSAALQRQPNVTALRARASAYIELGRWQNAGADLDKALATFVLDPWLWFENAYLRLQLQDLE